MPRDLVNHVCFVVDKSASIRTYGLADAVVSVFDDQVRHLVEVSKARDQETRVSVVLFSDPHRIEWAVWDKDVLRMPSLRGIYEPTGNTALIDATIEAINDLATVPTKHGDHAFLLYVVTDGEENRSLKKPDHLRAAIARVGDAWTFACLVPTEMGRVKAESFGFPIGNTVVWETSAEGMAVAGEAMQEATVRYFAGRSQGVRSTNRLFRPDTSKLDQKTVNTTLRRLAPADYVVLDVTTGPVEIADFVEVRTGAPYRRGSAFYRLAKKETVQSNKEIAVVHKRTGVAYAGPEARSLLGLPDTETRVEPASTPDYDLFVQSTSVNRKLVPGDQLLVRR